MTLVFWCGVERMSSTCKRCGQLGHWAAECAFPSQAAAEAQGFTPNKEPSKEPQPQRPQPSAEPAPQASLKALTERRAQLMQEVTAIDRQMVLILAERKAKELHQKALAKVAAEMSVDDGW